MTLVQSTDLPIGEWEAPGFRLLGADEKEHESSDYDEAKALVIVFTCNHCPYAQAAWPLLIDLWYQFEDDGVQLIAINPNDPEEYPEDSYKEMQKRVIEWRIPFPYLYDETQEVAKKYDAQCTPDIYVFDRDRKLYYHGRVNDNWRNPEEVQREDLKEALEGVVKGYKPPVVQYASMGCSIKWRD